MDDAAITTATCWNKTATFESHRKCTRNIAWDVFIRIMQFQRKFTEIDKAFIDSGLENKCILSDSTSPGMCNQFT